MRKSNVKQAHHQHYTAKHSKSLGIKKACYKESLNKPNLFKGIVQQKRKSLS